MVSSEAIIDRAAGSYTKTYPFAQSPAYVLLHSCCRKKRPRREAGALVPYSAYFLRLKKASLPAYWATSKSSSSMRSSWLYLADAVGAAGGAGLDLAGVQGHGEVGDGGVLGLAGAVGDDGGVARAVGHLDGVQGLGQGADLVDLDEDGVGDVQSRCPSSGARRW